MHNTSHQAIVLDGNKSDVSSFRLGRCFSRRIGRLGVGSVGMTRPDLRVVENTPWERAESYAPDLHELLAQQHREDVRGDLRVIAWGVAAALYSVAIFLVARAL